MNRINLSDSSAPCFFFSKRRRRGNVATRGILLTTTTPASQTSPLCRRRRSSPQQNSSSTIITRCMQQRVFQQSPRRCSYCFLPFRHRRLFQDNHVRQRITLTMAFTCRQWSRNQPQNREKRRLWSKSRQVWYIPVYLFRPECLTNVTVPSFLFYIAVASEIWPLSPTSITERQPWWMPLFDNPESSVMTIKPTKPAFVLWIPMIKSEKEGSPF